MEEKEENLSKDMRVDVRSGTQLISQMQISKVNLPLFLSTIPEYYSSHCYKSPNIISNTAHLV